LATGWGNGAGAAWALSPGGCRLVQSTATCNGRWLNSVPTNLQDELEELLLDNNTIRVLGNASVLPYQKLRYLSLSKNRLELIEPGAFLGSQGLHVLSLADNLLFTNYSVTAAAFSALPALRKLDLAGNCLSEDMVSVLLWNLSSLESLSVARNLIMRLDSSTFTNLTQLLELNLEKNYIFEIDQAFEGLQKLQRLNMAYNYIPCIAEFDLTQLRVLNISNNAIEWFLAVESNDLFELEVLDLSHNQLLFFPVLPRHNKLRSLLLKDNKLSFYQRLANAMSLANATVQFLLTYGNSTNITTVSLWDEICHSNLSSLQLLDMSQNRVWYLPEGFLVKMPSLTHLKLNQNCMEMFHVPEGNPLAMLTDLDLSQNRLSELRVDLPAGAVPNLQLFNLSTNRLTVLPAGFFTHTKKITTVDLSHNQVDLCPLQAVLGKGENLPCVDIRGITTLTHVSLAGCGLQGLGSHPFQGTPLKHLDLSDNQKVLSGGLGWLQDLNLTLQVLSLRNTNLSSSVVDIDFSGFQSLICLDLSGNSLITFPAALGILKLHTLDLRDNCLPALPQDVIWTPLGKSLREVYLSRNPYNCCLLGWWDSLQRVERLHVRDGQEVTCRYDSRTVSARALPENIIKDCQWRTADLVLLYLALALPTCLTFLVVFVIIFLTFKQKLLKMVKSQCGLSSPY
ncbi:NRROS regulator, partial [Nothoprocta ornata]|nr:NRROS regulator [Nothoprocta ornata]